MFGAYFFLSGQMQEHSRNVFNVMGLLAEFGGLFAIVAKLFAVIGLFINSRVHSAAMLNEMYYLKLSDKLDPKKGMWSNLGKLTNNLYEITFTPLDRLAEVRKGIM